MSVGDLQSLAFRHKQHQPEDLAPILVALQHDTREEGVALDLTACDREPIHLPGAIQPHGILLVLETGSERIARAAGDMDALLGFEGEAVGKRFSQVVGTRLMALTEGAGFAPGEEPLFLGSVQPTRGHSLDILAHERKGLMLVELEPSLQDRPSAARLLARLRAGVGEVKKAASLEDACQAAAEAVRTLTGHDRVLVYNFMEDGTGKVVAESGSHPSGSFRNHHFPASDVPHQARALYRQNLVRVIADVNYLPVPLSSAGASEGLDMSDCALRSVSPIHIQYLKNMGVASSMSVSILLGDTLWGLIVCHGTAPKLVPYEMREACKHLAASLTQQIETVSAREASREAERLASQREDLLAALAQSETVEVELKRSLPALERLIPSSGVIVCYGGTLAVHGVGPSAEQCRSLCDWTRRHDATIPYSSVALSSELGSAKPYAAVASGVLAITAGAEDPLDIIWLRPEYLETIDWAGKPDEKTAPGEQAGMLTPRLSFETWRVSVAGKSKPWTGPEIEAAQRLREGIERIRSRQHLNSLQAKVIHMSRVNAMGTMASAIAHELNQPLTIVRNYASGLSRMLEMRVDADPELLDVLGRVAEQALRAGEIVRHLRQLVSRGEVAMEPHRIRQLVASACSIALLDAPRLRVTAVVAIEGDAQVLVDAIQIQQVLLNLLKNAVEAMSTLEPARERKLTISSSRGAEGLVQVSVSDTGPGLPEDIRERLFSAFNSSKKDGLGIGLSICRTIVEAHGGKIWVDDSARSGATFHFTVQEALERA